MSKNTTSNQTRLKICHDRIVPDSYQPARAASERALLTNFRQALGISADIPVARGARGGARKGAATGTAAAARTQASANEIIDATGVIPAMRLALVTAKKWSLWDNNIITCRFMDGDATQRKKVEAKAHIWEKYANIKFKFVKTGDAQIRISFSADPGSWSAIGTDALVERYFPKYQPTMNFGWLEADSSDEDYESVVLHEFGHALGCIHEHQSPSAKLKWNKPEVYRVFSGPPNYWSKEDIDFNVFARYSKSQTNFTEFDPDSIMLYEFESSLFLDGEGTKGNHALSKMDKDFIGKMYPKD